MNLSLSEQLRNAASNLSAVVGSEVRDLMLEAAAALAASGESEWKHRALLAEQTLAGVLNEPASRTEPTREQIARALCAQKPKCQMVNEECAYCGYTFLEDADRVLALFRAEAKPDDGHVEDPRCTCAGNTRYRTERWSHDARCPLRSDKNR